MSAQPTWRYRILMRLLSPVLLCHLCWRSARDGGWRYFFERLGLGSSVDGPYRWIHAASVGEVMTVMPLIESVLALEPTTKVLLTTNTPTSAHVLSQQNNPRIVHRYLPLDFAGATRRFLRQRHAECGWIMETEIWPWLYAHCRQQGIHLSIINARVSMRTLRNETGFLASTYRTALVGVDVLARTKEDASRFKRLGSSNTSVQVIGNLKFADSRHTTEATPLIDTPYCVAASTHDDEELQLARAWLEANINCLLVVVPRHVERGPSVARQLRALQRDLAPALPAVSLRSSGDAPLSGARLYVADTLGELLAWYRFATGVFVGGSLIDRGGHNLLEPARLGKAIVVGPSTSNFADVAELMNALPS